MIRILITSLLMLLIMACMPEQPNYDLDAVKITGDPMVQSLELYKKMHGNYPASLQEAGISNITTSLGAFEYERRGKGNDAYFVLAVGDYSRNSFVIFWNSEMAPQGWLTEE